MKKLMKYEGQMWIAIYIISLFAISVWKDGFQTWVVIVSGIILGGSVAFSKFIINQRQSK